MGRPSPTQKKAKRRRQKVRRKLVFAEETACSFGEPIESESPHNLGESELHMGDVDTDVVEMVVYDGYRQIDGESYTPGYLFKCRERLMTKVQQYRSLIHKLEREIARVKSKNNERLRKYYETIAFAKSRSGRMVRFAMGTAKGAGKIIREMEALYSV